MLAHVYHRFGYLLDQARVKLRAIIDYDGNKKFPMVLILMPVVMFLD